MAAPENKQKDVADLAADDEFEEFAVDDWDSKAEDTANQQLWEADWDDDNVADDFAARLKEELAKQAAKQQK